MGIFDSLAKRRSYYKLNKELPVSQEEVVKTIEAMTEVVPDAFNMKSARVIVALKDNQDKLWDTIYDAFGGKVPRAKIDSFKAAAGTILYYYDENLVKALQEKSRHSCEPVESVGQIQSSAQISGRTATVRRTIRALP